MISIWEQMVSDNCQKYFYISSLNVRNTEEGDRW